MKASRSLLPLLFIAGLAQLACASIQITGTSISQTQTRDGQTLTLGYKISSSTPTLASLGCTLTGPNHETVEDDTNEGPEYQVTLLPGEYWYYRDFFVNLPPGASTGAYDVEWGVSWGASDFTEVAKPKALTILPPIQVRIPILMYHKVGPTAYSQYWVTTDMFGRQMRALKAYGYTAVILNDAMECRAGIRSLPAKPIVITFDDGYKDLLTDAYPQMVSAGIETATSYVITGRVGTDNSWDTGDNNPVIPLMSWDDILYLWHTGRIEIESHTLTHPDLTTLGASALSNELVNSATDLQAHLGFRPRYLSYPYGATNSTVRKAARAADYFAAVVSYGGVEATCANKWQLSRVEMDWNTSTDYDSGHPDNFLFNKIGEAISIPNISITSISYFDPYTGRPLSGNQVYRGSKVKIRVSAVNSGQANTVVAGLSLDSDANPGNGVAFESHIANQDITMNFAPGTATFEWIWPVPSNAPLGRYYASASFHDSNYVLGFAYSQPLWQQAFSVKALRQIKALADGAQPSCIEAPVSAAFPYSFYMESDDESAGIQVQSANDMSPGDQAVVGGTMRTDPNGERYIQADFLQKDGTGSLHPIGMTNRCLGGGDDQGYDPVTGAGQMGISDGQGLSNIGLLVKSWGKITSIGVGYFYVDDGSNLRDGTGSMGVRVSFAPGAHSIGEYVLVTGISSIFQAAAGRAARQLMPRSPADIVAGYHP